MRGHPWRQWLVFAAGWLALVWPILRVTDAVTAAPPDVAAPVAEPLTHAWMTLECSVVPAAFVVRQGDRVVWREEAPSDRRVEADVELAVDAIGVDFQVEVTLPDGTHAVEVTLDVDGQSRRARTLWAQGSLDERIEFLWGAR